jgi:hypothetical protein
MIYKLNLLLKDRVSYFFIYFVETTDTKISDSTAVGQNVNINKRVSSLSNQANGTVIPTTHKIPRVNIAKLPRQGTFETDIPISIIKA